MHGIRTNYITLKNLFSPYLSIIIIIIIIIIVIVITFLPIAFVTIITSENVSNKQIQF